MTCSAPRLTPVWPGLLVPVASPDPKRNRNTKAALVESSQGSVAAHNRELSFPKSASASGQFSRQRAGSRSSVKATSWSTRDFEKKVVPALRAGRTEAETDNTQLGHVQRPMANT